MPGDPTTPPPLEPGRLAALLEGGGPRPGSAWRVRLEDAAGSTNAVVAAEARSGAPEGVGLVVEHQTAGRGRLDRVWDTPRGSALTFSVLLRPTVPPEAWPWLPLLAGLAVTDGLAEWLGPDRAGLKWPNDVLVADRKICGILVERVDTPAGPAAVLGAGLNTGLDTGLDTGLHTGPAGAGPPHPGATSLGRETGAEPDRTALLAGLLRALAARYAAWCGADGAVDRLRPDYARSCVTLGRDVRVELPTGPPLAGRASDVDEAGRLVVAHPDGRTAVGAGDVVHVRAR